MRASTKPSGSEKRRLAVDAQDARARPRRRGDQSGVRSRPNRASAQAAPRGSGSPSAFRVAIIGAGKVGTGLARALRHAGAIVELRSLRKGLARRLVDADLLVLAVREQALGRLCEELAEGRVSRRTPVVHCSGILGPEVLDRLRRSCAGVAQMHPMISFGSARATPPLARGNLQVDGDRAAVRAARRLARMLGMSARTIAGLDRAAYHAAAGIVANGAATLAAAALELLVQAGAPRRIIPAMLGPLLASVAFNVERLGLPDALTGPVRRGDAAAVARHQAAIEARSPEIAPLFRSLVMAQVALARRLCDGPSGGFDAIEALVGRAQPGVPASVLGAHPQPDFTSEP